ncbi:MAG: anthranilate synthase component I family protein [Bacteroidetes bacterium]|nr:anthranilate synthase component I family protein [Bacteroidota bacterium]
MKADEIFKQRALQWAKQFEVVCILDNNACANAFNLHEIEFAIAVGVKDAVVGSSQNDWEKLKNFSDKYYGEEPIFGCLTYDLKNQLEALESEHEDHIAFPPLYFFVPEHLLLFDAQEQLMLLSEQGESILNAIKNIRLEPSTDDENMTKPILEAKVNKTQYIETIDKLKQHIVEGDVYEINYCVEFFIKDAQIDPYLVYERLKEKSPTPFGAFFKLNQQYLLCASPERFMKKEVDKLYSQPIKGTAKRASDAKADQAIKIQLLNSEKERAENLMIVDLVRNDLAKSSKFGSVTVDELFGIYSFKQVHQMISTVSATISPEVHPIEAIANAFPMGSMTGAPKVKAMELIEKYEVTKRGLYSGAIGYLAPNGDFDFNVVIRSIQYNAATKYLNFMVGSAITYDANPEQEYEECLLKAQAMLHALNAEIIYS